MKGEQEHILHFLRATRKFHVIVVQNNNVQKSVLHVQSCLFVYLFL